MECIFCQNNFVNKGFLTIHQNQCKLNPNRIPRKSNLIEYNKKVKEKLIDHPSWNKGQTKYTDNRIKNRTITWINNYRNGLYGKFTGKGKTEEAERNRREKISKSIINRYERGWMPKAGRCKKIQYLSKIAGNISLDGSWELKVAVYLDNNNIKWKRNTKKFKYIDLNNKERNYTPDFYLIDEDCYVEIKGYETELDRCKWRQFQNKLQIWNKDKLLELKIL